MSERALTIADVTEFRRAVGPHKVRVRRLSETSWEWVVWSSKYTIRHICLESCATADEAFSAALAAIEAGEP